MTEREELIKLLTEARDKLYEAQSGYIPSCAEDEQWNKYRDDLISRIDSALTAQRSQQEPVAWMWLEGTELLNGTEVEQFERIEFSREKPDDDAYGLTPLYTAPLSGVRAGMLRAAEICRKRAELRWEEHGITESDTNASYYPKAIENEMGIRDEESEDCANAITRAADPVNAEEKS